MAENKGENIFTKIVNRKLRERAFEAVLGEGVKCLLKVENGKLYHVKAVSRTGSHISIECTNGFEEINNSIGVFSFDLGDEKYFLKSQISLSSKNFVKISTTNDLFKLQRRGNFRVSLPLRFNASVKLDEYKGLDFTANDISLGGVSFDIPSNSPAIVKEGSKIQGSFQMLDDVHFHFTALVKHVRSVGSMGSGLLRIGIHFEPLDAQVENRLLEILIKIQKEDVSRSGESQI